MGRVTEKWRHVGGEDGREGGRQCRTKDSDKKREREREGGREGGREGREGERECSRQDGVRNPFGKVMQWRQLGVGDRREDNYLVK